MIVMERPNKFIADISIGARVLAEKCQNGGVATVWVSIVDLHLCSLIHCTVLFSLAVNAKLMSFIEDG